MNQYVPRVKEYITRIKVYTIKSEYPLVMPRLGDKPISDFHLSNSQLIYPRMSSSPDAFTCLLPN